MYYIFLIYFSVYSTQRGCLTLKKEVKLLFQFNVLLTVHHSD
jgi:hypothetical protein